MSASDGNGMSASDGNGMSASRGKGIIASPGSGILAFDGNGMSASDGRGMSASDGNGMSALLSCFISFFATEINDVDKNLKYVNIVHKSTRFIQASLCKIQGLFKDFSRLSYCFQGLKI